MGRPSPDRSERVGGTQTGYGLGADPALSKDDAAARTWTSGRDDDAAARRNASMHNTSARESPVTSRGWTHPRCVTGAWSRIIIFIIYLFIIIYLLLFIIILILLLIEATKGSAL